MLLITWTYMHRCYAYRTYVCILYHHSSIIIAAKRQPITRLKVGILPSAYSVLWVRYVHHVYGLRADIQYLQLWFLRDTTGGYIAYSKIHLTKWLFPKMFDYLNELSWLGCLSMWRGVLWFHHLNNPQWMFIWLHCVPILCQHLCVVLMNFHNLVYHWHLDIQSTHQAVQASHLHHSRVLVEITHVVIRAIRIHNQ